MAESAWRTADMSPVLSPVCLVRPGARKCRRQASNSRERAQSCASIGVTESVGDLLGCRREGGIPEVSFTRDPKRLQHGHQNRASPTPADARVVLSSTRLGDYPRALRHRRRRESWRPGPRETLSDGRRRAAANVVEQHSWFSSSLALQARRPAVQTSCASLDGRWRTVTLASWPTSGSTWF